LVLLHARAYPTAKVDGRQQLRELSGLLPPAGASSTGRLLARAATTALNI
jgi:hypothetical protein